MLLKLAQGGLDIDENLNANMWRATVEGAHLLWSPRGGPDGLRWFGP
jgi:hypothetical protein